MVKEDKDNVRYSLSCPVSRQCSVPVISEPFAIVLRNAVLAEQPVTGIIVPSYSLLHGSTIAMRQHSSVARLQALAVSKFPTSAAIERHQRLFAERVCYCVNRDITGATWPGSWDWWPEISCINLPRIRLPQ